MNFFQIFNRFKGGLRAGFLRRSFDLHEYCAYQVSIFEKKKQKRFTLILAFHSSHLQRIISFIILLLILQYLSFNESHGSIGQINCLVNLWWQAVIILFLLTLISTPWKFLCILYSSTCHLYGVTDVIPITSTLCYHIC